MLDLRVQKTVHNIVTPVAERAVPKASLGVVFWVVAQELQTSPTSPDATPHLIITSAPPPPQSSAAARPPPIPAAPAAIRRSVPPS